MYSTCTFNPIEDEAVVAEVLTCSELGGCMKSELGCRELTDVEATEQSLVTRLCVRTAHSFLSARHISLARLPSKSDQVGQ